MKSNILSRDAEKKQNALFLFSTAGYLAVPCPLPGYNRISSMVWSPAPQQSSASEASPSHWIAEINATVHDSHGPELVPTGNQVQPHPAPLISQDWLKQKGVYFLLNFQTLNTEVLSTYLFTHIQNILQKTPTTKQKPQPKQNKTNSRKPHK